MSLIISVSCTAADASPVATISDERESLDFPDNKVSYHIHPVLLSNHGQHTGIVNSELPAKIASTIVLLSLAAEDQVYVLDSSHYSVILPPKAPLWLVNCVQLL